MTSDISLSVEHEEAGSKSMYHLILRLSTKESLVHFLFCTALTTKVLFRADGGYLVVRTRLD